jgi:hypothetical protein
MAAKAGVMKVVIIAIFIFPHIGAENDVVFVNGRSSFTGHSCVLLHERA